VKETATNLRTAVCDFSQQHCAVGPLEVSESKQDISSTVSCKQI